MVVPSLAKARVVSFAKRVVLNTAARPVVHRIAKSLTAATAHHDLLALAALFGYRRDSAMSAQGVIIPLGDGVGSLREEIGRDQIPESWYREQQTDIAVCLAVGVLPTRRCHVIQQRLDSVADFLPLQVEQPQLWQQ